LLFLGENFVIKAVDFVQYVDYSIICLKSGKCVVYNYVNYDESNPSSEFRVINVGEGFSKISINEHQKFFTVTYPDTKQIAFYPLEEAFCDDWYHTATECTPWDTFQVIKCLPNGYVTANGRSCACKEGYVLNL
jgi:hypothetical protein